MPWLYIVTVGTLTVNLTVPDPPAEKYSHSQERTFVMLKFHKIFTNLFHKDAGQETKGPQSKTRTCSFIN